MPAYLNGTKIGTAGMVLNGNRKEISGYEEENHQEESGKERQEAHPDSD
jgi:hypothetical protein